MRSPRPPGLVVCVVLLALAQLGAGCGEVSRVGRQRRLHLGLTEYRVSPQSVHVRAGKLRIAVSNFGRLTHNMVLSRGGQSVASTSPIAPGQSAQLTVVVKRGTYLMASTILSDQALGEYGTLSVTR
jgi:hypothetical protein